MTDDGAGEGVEGSAKGGGGVGSSRFLRDERRSGGREVCCWVSGGEGKGRDGGFEVVEEDVDGEEDGPEAQRRASEAFRLLC